MQRKLTEINQSKDKPNRTCLNKNQPKNADIKSAQTKTPKNKAWNEYSALQYITKRSTPMVCRRLALARKTSTQVDLRSKLPTPKASFC